MDAIAFPGRGVQTQTVPNPLIDDPTPKDQAIYVPSVTPGYAMDAHARQWKRALPQGVGDGDLDFLDPSNKLFRISHVMSSAGQALTQTRPCIVTTRDRQSTFMIGDSGGYQIASGRLRIAGDADRHKILNWLEGNADVAMTLDVPTGPVLGGDYAYKSSKDCLTATLDHLAFFQKYRTPGKTRFLNVLQGNTTRESDTWYDAVKKFPFEGWAIAGLLRHNFYNVCRRILIMAHENQLQDKDWIHVLGTNEFETAVCLTALQRAINRHINPRLRISYDTSTPFRMIRWHRVYTVPSFSTKKMHMSSEACLDGREFIGSQVRFPWPSPLGDLMTMGDICVRNTSFANTRRDQQSNHYLNHHNLAALCYGVALANRVFDSEGVTKKHTIAEHVGKAVAAIEATIASGSLETLEKNKGLFAKLRHGSSEQPEDEGDRDLMSD